MQVRENAIELARAMENEDGVAGAVRAFFKQLPNKNKKNTPEREREREPAPSKFFLSKCFGCA